MIELRSSFEVLADSAKDGILPGPAEALHNKRLRLVELSRMSDTDVKAALMGIKGWVHGMRMFIC